MNEQHRNKVFYKKDGLLPYETRIGLLYETPNIELLKELGKRIKDREIVGLYTDYASLHVRKYPKLALSSESDNEVIFKLDLHTEEIESK